jgi:hypothetical protein
MKCTKWVVGLRLSQREFPDWYGQRSWTRDGVVRTMSRIDVPADGAALTPGRQQIAGIAYAGSRSISSVEYSSDGGATWRAAEVLQPPAANQWLRWTGSFDLPPGGSATLLARATDGVGNQQVQTFSLPHPDGGTGWPSIQVHAATEP